MSHQFANVLSTAIEIDDDNKYVIKINRVHVSSHWATHIHTRDVLLQVFQRGFVFFLE